MDCGSAASVVIRVAKETKYSRNLREKTPLEFYVPFFGGGVRMPPTVYVRGEQSAATIVGDIRRAVTRIEPLVTIRQWQRLGKADARRDRVCSRICG